MISIDLLPDERRDRAPHFRGSRTLAAVLAVLAAAVLAANLYYTVSVVPGLQQAVAEREARLQLRAEAASLLGPAEAELAARERFVAAARSFYGKPSQAVLLARVKNAVNAVHVRRDGAWLERLEGRECAVALSGVIAAPSEKAARAAADILTRELACVRTASATVREAAAGQWRFDVEGRAREAAGE